MTTIRAGGYAPRDSTHTRALEHIARRLDAAVDGAVAVEIVPNIMDLGRQSSDLLDMVEGGELTLCYFSTSYLGERVPELNALEVPFLFDTLDEAHSAMDGSFGAALTAATERRTGLEVLGYWDNGFRHLTNARHPVHVPEDVAGLRVRLQPNRVHEAMVEAWGGIPVAVELSRGIELLMAGEVDAQENPLANTTACGVDAIHPHVTMTAHLFGARGVYANPRSLEALPAEVADELRIAARDAIAFQRPAAAAFENETREKMAAAGTAFVDPTPDERAAFVAATARVAEWARSEVGEVVPWPT
ncbi:MAG TPA: TRAP transporter substrate-binding protein [Acidimicrobiia bacterium]